MPNGIKCIRRSEEFTSSFINKNLCPNAPNENKRIRRRRPMNLSAFKKDGKGHKLEPIQAKFQP